MILDAHAHLDLHEVTAEDYIRLKKVSGITKVVLLASLNGPIPRTPEWQISILRFLLLSRLRPVGIRIYESLVKTGNLRTGRHTIRIIHDPDNDSVAQALSQYPDDFMGFVVVNPTLPNALDILEKGISDGMVGVKCHAWWHQFDPAEDLLPVASVCEQRGLPILIHLGGGPRTGDFRSLLRRCPRLKLILAHAGIPHFQGIWKAIREEKNCFVDISGSYLNASLVRRAVAALGADKVLFGSDGPVSLRTRDGGHSYEPILQWTRNLPLPDGDIEKIFHGNLEKLLA